MGSLDKSQRGARQGRLCKEELFQQQLTGKFSQHASGQAKAPELEGHLAFYSRYHCGGKTSLPKLLSWRGQADGNTASQMSRQEQHDPGLLH